jgi:hypothetical protein
MSFWQQKLSERMTTVVNNDYRRATALSAGLLGENWRARNVTVGWTIEPGSESSAEYRRPQTAYMFGVDPQHFRPFIGHFDVLSSKMVELGSPNTDRVYITYGRLDSPVTNTVCWDGGGVRWTELFARNTETLLARIQRLELRSKLKKLGSLKKGWDSYDAEPPSALACALANKVLDALMENGISAERLIPTSDGSLLLKHRVGTGLATWEIDNDGEIGVMIEVDGFDPSFHSPSKASIQEFVTGIVRNG